MISVSGAVRTMRAPREGAPVAVTEGLEVAVGIGKIPYRSHCGTSMNQARKGETRGRMVQDSGFGVRGRGSPYPEREPRTSNLIDGEAVQQTRAARADQVRLAAAAAGVGRVPRAVA